MYTNDGDRLGGEGGWGDRGGGCLSLSLWVGKEGGGIGVGVVCLFHCGWGRRVGDGGGGQSLTLLMGEEGGDRGRGCLSYKPPVSYTVDGEWGSGMGAGGLGGGDVCCLLHCESFSSDCLPGTRQAGPWWRCPRSGRGSLCCC